MNVLSNFVGLVLTFCLTVLCFVGSAVLVGAWLFIVRSWAGF